MKTNLSRRHFVQLLGASAAAQVLGVRLADAKAPFLNAGFPEWSRFKHGTFECTVISDGPLPLPGDPSAGFPSADPDELRNLLRSGLLPTDLITLDQNIFVVNTGDQLVLIDTGSGVNKAFGIKYFGNQVGQVVPRLKRAGISPGDIDVVAITHAHPDHSWGLVDDEGRLLYPNARIAISQVDYDFWTDESKAPKMPEGLARDMILGTALNLKAVRERITFLKDGSEVVPGITAIAAPGHSPGHMIFAITSAGKTMMAIGDLSHHHILLLKKPMWSFRFDSDPKQAAETRVKMFDMIAREGHQIASFHFPFPGNGHLTKDGSGYSWIPKSMTM